ncbi:MAG: LptF/LptG family permease, partial [Candidatus Zipacnadales bacterium]
YLPQTVGWVLPVAIIFGTIMAIGRLSADGELIAMHAGGISFPRILLPVLVVGLLGVGSLHVVLEVIAPRTLTAATQLFWRYHSQGKPRSGFVYADKDDRDRVRRIVAADRLNPRTRTLTGVVFAEYRNGQPWQVVTAEKATWQGQELLFEHPQTTVMTAEGPLTFAAKEARHQVGDPPDVVEQTERRPEAMTVPQMRERIRMFRERGASVAQTIRPLEQAIAVRFATPWCALGFALVSAPLGIRRVRSSPGINLGMSVLVFLPYYFVTYTLQVLNKHGGIHPLIPAWTGNILLFVVALGLILDKSR